MFSKFTLCGPGSKHIDAANLVVYFLQSQPKGRKWCCKGFEPLT